MTSGIRRAPGEGVRTVSAAMARSGLVPVDAQVLLAHVLGVDRAWLIGHATDELPRASAEAFFALAKRRRDGEPVAYLTGRREFYGLDLAVTPAVLIPRPETETLVEVLLERLPADRATRVADLGTGSGAIALALAAHRPLAKVVATDASEAALDVARGNAARHRLTNVSFCAGDWFDALPDDAPPFDAIAANPPYVAADDPHMARGDLPREPVHALTPGGDGLDALRTIIALAPARLLPGGWLAVEHGHDQSDEVTALFEQAGFDAVAVRRDLAGIPRVVAGRVAAR
ncbi:MAG: release factor glutamine methyltransferase [Burkholderiales bacterium]